MRSGGWLRFALEVAFIVMVAAGAAAARLSPVGIAAALGGAFALAGLVEYMGPRWASWRLPARPILRRRAAPPPRRETPAVRPTPPSPAPYDIRRERPERPTVTPPEPAPAGGPAAAAAAAGHAPVRRPGPAAPPRRPPVVTPPPAPARREPEERPAPEPERLAAPLALPPAPVPVTEPPRPAPMPPPAPPPAAPAPPPPPAPAPPPPPPPRPAASPPRAAAQTSPARWNVFELERRVRAAAGGNPDRDEEWRYMLLYLRDHASADGTLPVSFDGLIRESFQEIVPSGR